MCSFLLSLLLLSFLVAPAAAQTWQTLPSMPVNRSDFAVLPVNTTLYVMGGCIANQDITGGCPTITNRLESFDTATNRWTERTAAPTNRTQYIGCAVGNVLYYVGGRDVNGDVVGSVDVYNAGTGVWSTLPDQGGVTSRSNGACFVIGSTLYVTGGYDEYYNSLNTTITLTPPATQFQSTTVPSKPIAAGDCQANAIANTGYVFGGFSSQEADGNGFCHPLATVERYDAATNRWALLNETGFIGRGLPASGVVGGLLYVMGGEAKGVVCVGGNDISHPEPTVQSFNPATATFTTVNTLPTSRFRFSGAAVGSTLYNIGGQGGEVVTNSSANVTDPSVDSGYFPVTNLVEALTLGGNTTNNGGGCWVEGWRVGGWWCCDGAGCGVDGLRCGEVGGVSGEGRCVELGVWFVNEVERSGLGWIV